jgi:hypothetical protein
MLGSYMSGNNEGQARCRETQPVVMCYQPDVRLLLPRALLAQLA